MPLNAFPVLRVLILRLQLNISRGKKNSRLPYLEEIQAFFYRSCLESFFLQEEAVPYSVMTSCTLSGPFFFSGSVFIVLPFPSPLPLKDRVSERFHWNPFFSFDPA